MGLPIPKLSDKTFNEIFTDARALISRYSSTWTDQNFHDPGITIIDLFAWLAEMQIYYLDRVTDDHKRKFLEMVGFAPLGPQPARVPITVCDLTVAKTFPAATRVEALIGTDRMPFETTEEIFLIPVNLKAVKTYAGSLFIDRTEANARGEISFPAFGDEPRVGAVLRIGFDKPLPPGNIPLTVRLFEGDLPPAGSHGDEDAEITPSVEVVWEYLSGGLWQPLTVKDDGTLALNQSGRVIVAGPPAMDEVDGSYWIQCRLSGGSIEIAPMIHRVLLNTVTLVQIDRVVNEFLGQGDGSPGFTVSLKKPPVIECSLLVETSPDCTTWEAWHQVECFDTSDPADRHYLFDPNTGELVFGNGLNGRIPGTQDRIRASYRTTLGDQGNIPPLQRFSFGDPDLDKIPITNLEGAAGGKDAESIPATTVRMRKDLRTQYRAITTSDFEEVAKATPGLRLARVKAITNYNPRYPCLANFPNMVTVVVVPVTRSQNPVAMPGPGFIDTVARHLDRHRLVTTGVQVIGPKYVKISVGCTVQLKKRSSPAVVTASVQEALAEFLDPLKGGMEHKGWPFGRSVFPAEIYQILDEIEAVDFVTDLSISAEGEYQEDGNIIKIPSYALVYSGAHQIAIRDRGTP